MSTRSQFPSERTRVRRLHERGHYDRATIDAILDTMPLCHVGIVVDGCPVVTPTLQWREGDHVYWHGSTASRMICAAEGAEVCLTVAILDGFVLARSAFHHSVNYRSVMLFGRAEKVAGAEAKAARLQRFIDGLFPGRWPTLRPMTEQELKATTVLSLRIDEASAKVRTGPPKDDEEDYALPIWSGVLPVWTEVGTAEDDPRNLPGIVLPEHATSFRFGSGKP